MADIHVVALQKQHEQWVFLIHPGGWLEFCEVMADYAHDPELDFDMEDIRTCSHIFADKLVGDDE